MLNSQPFYPNSIVLRNFDVKPKTRHEKDIVIFGLHRLQNELAEHILLFEREAGRRTGSG